MNKVIADYINAMGKKISNRKARSSAKEEIFNHLLDQIEVHLLAGKSWQEAVDLTMQEATPAKELGKKLNLAHRHFLLRYPLTLFFSTTTVTGFLALVFLANYAVSEVKDILEKSVNSKVMYADFFMDMEDLKKNNLFIHSRQKNVHFLLSDYLELYEERNTGKLKYKDYCVMKKSLRIEDRCHFDFKNKEILLKTISNLENKKIDISWIDKILDYDHWNFFADPITKKHLKSSQHKSVLTKINIVSSYRVPSFKELQHLVFLRAKQLIEKGESEKAQSILNHSFSLFMSTHSLAGGSFASYHLRRINDFIETLNLKTWKKFDEEEIRIYKRISWGWAAVFADLSASDKYFDRLQEYLKPEFGACIGANEQPMSGSIIDFYQSEFLFEPDYHISKDKITRLLTKMYERCNMPEFLPLVSKSIVPFFGTEGRTMGSWVIRKDLIWEWRADEVALNLFSYIPINPTRFPYVRSIIGSYLLSVAVPNFSAPYTNEKTRRKKSKKPIDIDKKQKS